MQINKTKPTDRCHAEPKIRNSTPTAYPQGKDNISKKGRNE